MDTNHKHTISMRVHNRPGVLSRVAQVFARRGFNIDSLVVSRGHHPDFSRMTIVCQGDPAALDQIVKQLRKLVDTTHATEYVPDESVERELALFKLKIVSETRTEVFQVIDVFKGRTVDISDSTVTVEVTGDSDKVDAFESLVNHFGIIEMVRSGKLIIARGAKRT
ncbi:MAG: acetolactate synthase small subunit [Planctomycetes bacterium]|nr:acetolactate synthase small subunit [Planctomycetota bacterium]